MDKFNNNLTWKYVQKNFKDDVRLEEFMARQDDESVCQLLSACLLSDLLYDQAIYIRVQAWQNEIRKTIQLF